MKCVTSTQDLANVRHDRLARLMKQVAAASMAAALAACGGGGGGGSSGGSAPAPAPVPAPAPIPVGGGIPGNGDSGVVGGTPSTTFGAPQASASASSYGADLAAAYDFINAARLDAGVGAVNQVAQIDTAAAGHANYLTVNSVVSHSQNAANPGFTGVTLGNRLTASSYSYIVALEDIAPDLQSPLEGARDLLTMPYHRLGLLDHRTRDIGMGYSRRSALPSLGTFVPVLGYTSAGAQDMVVADKVSLYPMAGQADVPTMMGSESPNPVVTELGAWRAGFYPGFTVSAQVLATSTLAVTSFTLTNVTTGAPVSVKLIDKDSTQFLQPNGITNWAFIVPLAPLAQNTVYEASLVGTVDPDGAGPAAAVPLTKTWTFTTRSPSFAAEPARRGATSDSWIIDVTTGSGYLERVSVTPNASCTTGGYNIIGSSATKQSVWLRASTSGPAPAGCAVDIVVKDRGSNVDGTVTVALDI